MQNEVNQEGDPDYDLGTEYPWQRLGGDSGSFWIRYGTATVQLVGLANGKIAADAVRLIPALNEGFDHEPGTWDQREENGFYGGLWLNLQNPDPGRVEVYFENPADPNPVMVNITMRKDRHILDVYLDEPPAGKLPDEQQAFTLENVRSQALGDPVVFYLKPKAEVSGHVDFVLTLTGDSGLQRPIADILRVSVAWQTLDP